jgi:hypothetical protein
VASEPNTRCISTSLDILNAGESIHGDSTAQVVSFSNPVLLVQFLKQSNIMLLVQATEQYLSKYLVQTPQLDAEQSNMRIIITMTNQNQRVIRVDGNTQSTEWHDIKDSQPILSTTSITLANVRYHTIEQVDGRRFGLVLETVQSDGCISVFVPGMCFKRVSFIMQIVPNHEIIWFCTRIYQS